MRSVPMAPVKLRLRASGAPTAAFRPIVGKNASAAASTSAGATLVRWKWRMGSGAQRALGEHALDPVHPLQGAGGVGAELHGHRPLAGGEEVEPAVVRADLLPLREAVPRARPVVA